MSTSRVRADEFSEVTPPVQPITAETRSVGMWGEAKGLLPMWLHGVGAAGERRINPEYWKLGAAMALKKWDLTAQVSEGDFDAAVAEIQTHVHR